MQNQVIKQTFYEFKQRVCQFNRRIPHRLADIIGTVIGLLTLTLPLLVIANYSSANIPNTQPSLTYNLKQK